MDEVSVTAENSAVSAHQNNRHDAPLRYNIFNCYFSEISLKLYPFFKKNVYKKDIAGWPRSYFVPSGAHLH